MKKVRYVVGAVGVLGAGPALGLMLPAAAANAAAAAPAAHGGKAVSLGHGPEVPLAERCEPKSKRTTHSGAGVNTFSGTASGEGFGGTPCLWAVQGELHHSQVGLEMRVREYHGATEKSLGYVHGTINLAGTSTHFSKFIDGTAGSDVTKVCEALVYSSNHAVAYGQICQTL
jgi:hypothetical protein